jgi:hypothetical protein
MNRTDSMKIPSFLLVLASIATLAGRAFSQGTFQNLNFEATTIPQTNPPGLVDASAAIPGWTPYIGSASASNQTAQIGFNDVALGSTWITLLGTNSGTIYHSINGGYSLLLQGGATATDASIAQTGFVPITALSIRFKAQPENGTFLVSLGGHNIPYFELAAGPNYALYGGDISAYAGQTAELRFSALHSGAAGPNDWNLDDIQFSNLAAPEPSPSAMLVLAAFCFALWRRALRK